MKKIFLLFILLFTGSSLFAQSWFDSTWTNYFRRNSGGWTAGDATISVKLPDNRVLWLFGDSYTVPVAINNTLPCLFQVRNCMMVQDSVDRSFFKTILDTTQTGVNQTPLKLVPNDTTLFWPGAGYVRNDTVFIFLERYHSTTYDYLGCYLAKLTFPDLHQIGIYQVHNIRSAIYGRAVFPDEESGKLYIYGNKLNWIVWEPIVARCDINNPLSKWEYFNGTDWTIFSGQVQKISDEVVSPGFSVFPYNAKYILITQENGYLECGLGREIYSMESDLPQGPFTNKKLLYTEETTFNDHYTLTYNAQAHPWATENNELLIGYNVNDRVDTLEPNVCPSQCVNVLTDRLDADTYRPKFVRVPMDMIVSASSLEKFRPETRIFPNPVKAGNGVNISFSLMKENLGKIILYDPAGKIISMKQIIGSKGLNSLTIEAPPVAGICFLEIKTDSGSNVSKLIITR